MNYVFQCNLTSREAIFFFIEKFQLINVEGMTEWENHHFATSDKIGNYPRLLSHQMDQADKLTMETTRLLSPDIVPH